MVLLGEPEASRADGLHGRAWAMRSRHVSGRDYCRRIARFFLYVWVAILVVVKLLDVRNLRQCGCGRGSAV
jgi:hypothetical protein